MRKLVLLGVVFTVLPALGAGLGLKAGLWETRIIRQVVDGRDVTSVIAGASSQMQQAMANMAPAQRARVEAMLKQQSGATMGGNGTLRMCISAEMASRDNPIVGQDAHCPPAAITRNGNRTTFQFNCTSNGTTSTGKGESTAAGDLITTQIDATAHQANGETHVIHSETEMKFLGPDCGDVKPLPNSAPQ